MNINYDDFREDLRFPAFKLWERAEYERECAAADGQLCLSGGSDEEIVYASEERTAEYKANCLKRAADCDAALAILRAAT